ncbi:MAG: hypothetical protein EBU67_03390 [Actinobacteria bacterium]|nr:hypothetical protein [Actinomycetota bacterium]
MESETMFCPVKRQTVEERRQEILETTCRVVIERGFAGTRVSDVAQRLATWEVRPVRPLITG